MISPNGPSPFRNGLISQAGSKKRTSDDLPLDIGRYVPVYKDNPSQDHGSGSAAQRGIDWKQLLRQLWTQFAHGIKVWRPRDILGIQLILIIIWMIVLWWGEEAVFRRNVQDCAWDRWESWPAASNPHHVVLIADPQLVDPHTYPGRPWPLSTLTIRYTDLYMRKSFQEIQSTLYPDSVIFLGDLFDGGREWSTPPGGDETESHDKRWRKYGQKFWMKEYRRFSRIFFEPWLRGNAQGGQGQRGRRLIAGLPGNHDLGLGNGIRMPVRRRFNAYFGDGNRIDVVGNHTFVSLDTVSLSAKGQPDPATGSQGIAEGDGHNKEIWGPVDQFLHLAATNKARAIERELRVQFGKAENEAQDPEIIELNGTLAQRVPLESHKSTDIPSVILTHVPLYRAPGTPCGPLRERFPPSKGNPEKDDPNSIHVQAGVQYQNVLTPAVSNEIVDLIGDATHVFSGDDHDYCDVIHRGYTSKNGGIREVTVKSISWAMGVRKPGFVLLSLWNPVDAEGKAIGQETTKATTIQSRLCLLPDQLGIFIRYGWTLAFTILVLLIRASQIGLRSSSASKEANGHLLPLSKMDSSNSKQQGSDVPSTQTASARSLPSTRSSQSRLTVRSSTSRPRSLSPSNGYGYPASAEAEYPPCMDKRANGAMGDKGRNDIALDESSRRRRGRGLLALFDELRSSVLQVGSLVILWYIWLLWNS